MTYKDPSEHPWPPEFDRWARESQVAYVKMMWSRPELVGLIGEFANIRSIQDREPDENNARLSKDELAELALFLGMYRRELSEEDDPWSLG